MFLCVLDVHTCRQGWGRDDAQVASARRSCSRQLPSAARRRPEGRTRRKAGWGGPRRLAKGAAFECAERISLLNPDWAKMRESVQGAYGR